MNIMKLSKTRQLKRDVRAATFEEAAKLMCQHCAAGVERRCAPGLPEGSSPQNGHVLDGLWFGCRSYTLWVYAGTARWGVGE